MKTTRILSVLLTLTILTGSVPYGYAYCMLMKRALDSSMQLRCDTYRGIDQHSRGELRSLSSANSMKRFLSKSTTDSYEHRPSPVNGHLFTILLLVDYPSIQSNCSPHTLCLGVEHPPSDIILENLNLRI